MRAIMVMFDTLNRHMLPPYGCDWTHLPNFSRLAEKTAVFDRSYIGSMACMPARKDLQTGRYNFLHRSWGPMEPYDDSMPELLKTNGVHTHLVTDHQHYWEDGGGTYHTRYSTYDLIRGQEGDPWRGQLRDPEIPPQTLERPLTGIYRQDWVNRGYLKDEADYPQARTFEAGLDFIRTNQQEDRWFLQLETFDPHEPFLAPERYRQMYPHDYSGKHFDWPPYDKVNETPEDVEHMRYEYAALLSMCDHYLGKVLDLMDENDMWKDTMLIVNTDHGFLLGEHDWWAKCIQPLYNEVAHTPLFIWDPRCGAHGERRQSLVQNIDLAPTLLEFFGVDIPPDMTGKPLKDAIASDAPVREAALFGVHGAHVNVTDGRYVYMRAPVSPDNMPLYNYTLMPTHMRSRFSVQELQQIELQPPFAFTKGVSLLKIESARSDRFHGYGTMLFDVEKDPRQQHPIQDEELERRMIKLMLELMAEHDSPEEQYVRLGLERG
ncbi:sulfatase [Paenibacillus sp. PAMC21692]|uniref:sulfatase n=1 Tax=Paenibacillus sp. PAMC21692 TaxID=2762320 RepID=UPI00164DE692|nr:sulfatase [Paenibacillus sp. PAMC21692]QNK57899.1 sulfatase [Paenibacillus sp. PAMC21692]